MATSARPKPSRNRAPGPIGNANGLIVPKTEPNLGGGSTQPPVKTDTPQEAKSWLDRAGELIDKGEIKALAEAKDKLNALIDRGVEASGYNPIAMVAGSVAKAAVTVLAPDNVIDLIPGGKAASGANKARKAIKGVEAAGDAVKAGGKVADAGRAAKVARNTGSDGGKGAKGANGGGGGRSNGSGKKRDPCKHPRDAKKKKYVIYQAEEFDKDGNLLGTYVGRTSGDPNESTKRILDRRRSSHHRSRGGKRLGSLEPLWEVDSYAAVRGAEQIYKDKLSTVKQIEPVGPRNKRRDDYLDCAGRKGLTR